MLSEVRLRHFKAFKDTRVQLRPLTLLSGINGSGKSTVLQSLGALRQSHDAGCLSEGLLLNGEFVELGTGKDVLYEYADAQEIGIEVKERDTTYSWQFRYAEKDDLIQVADSPSCELSQLSLFTNPLQFLKADRITPATVFQKSYAQVVRRRFLGIRGQFAVDYLAIHQDETVRDVRRHPGRNSGATLIDQTSAWLAEISPGVVVGAKEVLGADLAQLWFTFGGRAGLTSSNEYRPTNVGFGLTYSLPIVIACLSASPGDLLLLENPEAHLHPRGQSALADLICHTARDGVQVIFESHSDHVMNGIRRCVKKGVIEADAVAMHFCEFDSGDRAAKIVSPEVQPDGRLSRWPEGFFDEWESALTELI